MVHWVTGILRDRTGSYDFAFMICTGTAALGLVLICLVKAGQAREKGLT